MKQVFDDTIRVEADCDQSDEGLGGRYSLKSELSKGTFSKVFLGDRVSDGKAVAIKRIAKAALTPEDLKNARKECKHASSVFHPNIVQFVEVLENRDHFFIITRYVDGPSIEEVIISPRKKSRPMIDSLARRFFTQLLSAVEYLHSCGLAHRDIKPANLLLDSSYRQLYLCDFGNCTAFDLAGGPRKHSPCGSLLYAAPELLTTGIYLGPEVDLWSCGVTLFAMLTGTLPFYHPKDRAAVRTAIRFGKFEWPEDVDVSDSAKDLVQKLLTVDVAARINLADAMRHSWVMGSGSSDDGGGMMSVLRQNIHLGKMSKSPSSRSGSRDKEGPRVSSFQRRIEPLPSRERERFASFHALAPPVEEKPEKKKDKAEKADKAGKKSRSSSVSNKKKEEK